MVACLRWWLGYGSAHLPRYPAILARKPMIFCAHCSHENPDSASQCEACYAPLPITGNCGTCGASVPGDASFCGACGAKLRHSPPTLVDAAIGVERNAEVMVIPDLGIPHPLQPLDSVILDGVPTATLHEVADINLTAERIVMDAFMDLERPSALELERSSALLLTQSPPDYDYALATSPKIPPYGGEGGPLGSSLGSSLGGSKTHLQSRSAYLLHLQTNTMLAVPHGLTVVHIGKPNDRIPPDIDVANFPHSEVVSRIHADIRVEGDVFFLEDVGSANGTYINNLPLPPGNRHRLRVGDRIAFGKGNLVTFLFQLS
jgi:hypothetical protein